ncbi:MAG: thymidine kinase [Vigna little leaf phytoplasma]|nr:thymidine kinase [Vigna little leaf phytoplasma]
MNLEQYDDGFIEIICGPMFSGKTTELIKKIKFFETHNIKFLVFKPYIDNRYSQKKELVTHDFKFFPSLLINKSEEILGFLEKDIKVLVIDEIQFFDEGIRDIVNNLSYRGISIIASGLDTDFCGRPFGSMGYLLSIADKVIKLKSFCSVCGRYATKTQRIINNKIPSKKDPIILVGGKNYHEPRCRECHKFSD